MTIVSNSDLNGGEADDDRIDERKDGVTLVDGDAVDDGDTVVLGVRSDESVDHCLPWKKP